VSHPGMRRWPKMKAPKLEHPQRKRTRHRFTHCRAS
jgi:hypothetical protein